MEDMYIRHYPLISESGQKKIAESNVVVVGAGALGSWEAYLLKKLGVKHVKVIDRDFVDITDLPRTVYVIKDIGKPKVEALKSKLDVEGYLEDLNPGTLYLLDDADVIVDGTDNIYTRQVINDYCVKNGIPWTYVGIIGYYGNIMAIIPEKTACFRCIFPHLPSKPMPTCATEGIMSYVAPFAASLAVSLTEKILIGEHIKSELTFFDLKTMQFEKIEVPKNERCECCIHRNFTFLKKKLKIERTCKGEYVITPPERMDVDINEMENRLKKSGVECINLTKFIEFIDRDVKVIIFKSGRMVIDGVKSEKEAMGIFFRYVG